MNEESYTPKTWKDAVMEALQKIPMEHHITAHEIRFNYYGNCYNNSLDCFCQTMASRMEKFAEKKYSLKKQ